MTEWRPAIGDYVLVTLAENEQAARYVVRGSTAEKLILCEVWCADGELIESPRRREISRTDVFDLRRAQRPDC